MLSLTPLYFYLILAVVLIVLELVIFQFSVFWFIFIGLGALVAAIAAWFLGSEGWLMPTAVFVVASVVITAALLRPLRRWQSKPPVIEGNTAIGQRVEVLTEITPDAAGKAHWSGADWQAKLADGETATIVEGQSAEIVALDGICLYVKAL